MKVVYILSHFGTFLHFFWIFLCCIWYEMTNLLWVPIHHWNYCRNSRFFSSSYIKAYNWSCGADYRSQKYCMLLVYAIHHCTNKTSEQLNKSSVVTVLLHFLEKATHRTSLAITACVIIIFCLAKDPSQQKKRILLFSGAQYLSTMLNGTQ